MKLVIQRVTQASVTIDGAVYSRIARGFVILLGVRRGDTPQDADFLADKASGLRVFEDAQGKMNLSLQDVGGQVLVISQFTLYGDAQKGNRPSFTLAAPPEEAEPLYERFVQRMESNLGTGRVHTGVFRAMMDVALVNEGPVTILIESNKGQS